MKSGYVVCMLLVVTIGSVILADYGGVTQATVVNGAPTTAIPLPLSTVTTLSNNITINDTKRNDKTTTPVPTNAPTTVSSPTTKNTTINPTTPSSTTPVPPTTPNSTETTTTTTTIKTTSVHPTSAVPSTIVPPKTTAVPPSPQPSSTARHFDGLSFFGGIILATCLIAIAVFSLKFYRTCNEGNYRTL